MNKDRLGEIKKAWHWAKWNEEIPTLGLEDEWIDWLIEQAERVQELEDEVDRLKVWYGAYHRETKATERLREKNKRYCDALQKIINEEQHNIGYDYDNDMHLDTYILMVAGNALGLEGYDNSYIENRIKEAEKDIK